MAEDFLKWKIHEVEWKGLVESQAAGQCAASPREGSSAFILSATWSWAQRGAERVGREMVASSRLWTCAAVT